MLLCCGKVRKLNNTFVLSQPWGILTAIIGGALFFALPAWRFRSTWMSIIIHSSQSVFFSFLILGVVLGLA
jgi:hypothetical protein